MSKTVNLKGLNLVVLSIAAVFLTSCGALNPEPSALSNEEVVTQVKGIFSAIEADDYESFTADFDSGMLEAFSETEFAEFRDMITETSGALENCSDPRLLNQQEFAVYVIPCEFEKEDVTVTIVYRIGGDQVSGLFVDSANIRSYTENQGDS